MKLSAWAAQQGVKYKAAPRWFHLRILPAKAIQLPTGPIIVTPPPESKPHPAALYARVSSKDQRGDLERQTGRLVTYATRHGHQVGRVVEEGGLGLNGRRSRLLTLLRDPNVGSIIAEHRDRLARFGTGYIVPTLAPRSDSLS
jgi:putative resolvase